jgi:hypothetical protein
VGVGSGTIVVACLSEAASRDAAFENNIAARVHPEGSGASRWRRARVQLGEFQARIPAGTLIDFQAAPRRRRAYTDMSIPSADRKLPIGLEVPISRG